MSPIRPILSSYQSICENLFLSEIPVTINPLSADFGLVFQKRPYVLKFHMAIHPWSMGHGYGCASDSYKATLPKIEEKSARGTYKRPLSLLIVWPYSAPCSRVHVVVITSIDIIATEIAFIKDCLKIACNYKISVTMTIYGEKQKKGTQWTFPMETSRPVIQNFFFKFLPLNLNGPYLCCLNGLKL